MRGTGDVQYQAEKLERDEQGARDEDGTEQLSDGRSATPDSILMR